MMKKEKKQSQKRKQKDEHRLIKEKICEALEGRKEKEETVITLFFGCEGEERNAAIINHKEVYKALKRNLKKMDNNKLNNIVQGMINIRNGLLK